MWRRHRGGEKGLVQLQEREADLRDAGDFEGALGVLDEMLEIDERFSPALNNKAAILLMSERYEEALPLLRRAVEVEPTNGQAWCNLGRALHGSGRPEDAVPALRESLERGYRHEGVLSNMASAQLACGDLDGALESWSASLRMNPFQTALTERIASIAQMFGVTAPARDPAQVAEDVREATRDWQVTKVIRPRQGVAVTLTLERDGETKTLMIGV